LRCGRYLERFDMRIMRSAGEVGVVGNK